MMVYICTKFHENILNGIRFMERIEKLMDGQTARHNTTRLRRAYKNGNGRTESPVSHLKQISQNKAQLHTSD